MVDIYVKQGLLGDALALCDDILRDDPGNQSIARRASEIKMLMARDESTVSLDSPGVIQDQAAPVTPQKTVIEILEDWLVAINKRRSNVQ